MDHLCYLCPMFVMLSRLIIAALWSTCWERADRLALVSEVNSITFDNFTFLFNCMPVGRTPGSMTVPT